MIKDSIEEVNMILLEVMKTVNLKISWKSVFVLTNLVTMQTRQYESQVKYCESSSIYGVKVKSKILFVKNSANIRKVFKEFSWITRKLDVRNKRVDASLFLSSLVKSIKTTWLRVHDTLLELYTVPYSSWSCHGSSSSTVGA
jgi:hypothetical protein